MSDKKISELTLVTPSVDSVVPCSNSSGTATNKITLQSILDLETRWNLFLPPAPTSVTASAGNAQAVVSWTAPTGVIAQAPITDYTVQFQPSGGSWQTFSDGTSTATSATVTGLTNGTAYQFRVAAVNSVGTGSYSTASTAVTVGAPTDPYFSNVSLLLHADGSGSTFVDSSPTPKTITAVGATQSATQSKFGGKSAQLLGNGAKLTTPGSSSFAYGTGDFVVEFWLYAVSFDSYNILFSQAASGTNYFLIAQESGSIVFRFGSGGGTIVAGPSIGTGGWYHVAVVRSSGSARVYVNGTGGDPVSCNLNFTDTSYQVTVGSYDYTPQNSLNGYIDDLRITKGSNRGYTGSTIPVPTAAFPDS